MNANYYVNKIVKKIKCSSTRKKEIKKELMMEIELRQEQGESLEDIISQMGNIREIADSFNQNISSKEKRKYVLKKSLTIIAGAAIILLLAGMILYRIIPRSANIENSEYFDKRVVEDSVKETIILLDDEKYGILQEKATKRMKEFIPGVGKAKLQVAAEWGERQSFGTVYMTEIIQGNQHYAVAEVAVSYELISVIYRVTYDKDMKIAGIYIR